MSEEKRMSKRKLSTEKTTNRILFGFTPDDTKSDSDNNDETNTNDNKEIFPEYKLPDINNEKYTSFQEERKKFIRILPSIKYEPDELQSVTVKLSSEVVLHIKDHAVTKNNEFMFELTNGETGEPNTVPSLNPIEGKQSQHDPENFVCTKLTCHTHHSERVLNPPSSWDIHSFILSIRKTRCTPSEKQRIILSHCVISKNAIFVFTFNPVYLTVPWSVLDILIEVFANLDFLAGGGGPLEETYIGWDQYKGLAMSVGIEVDRYKFPNTNKLPIEIRILTTKPLDMVVDSDEIISNENTDHTFNNADKIVNEMIFNRQMIKD
jgi:hypothetical protein